MFSRLHHEAFHAYLENYVYPHEDFDVPLWLNEGLAVLFEGGLLESDSLRIDAPNAAALKRLKADLGRRATAAAGHVAGRRPGGLRRAEQRPRRRRPLLPLRLGVGPLPDVREAPLGSPALDAYVQPASAAADSSSRFEKLVGMPLSRFEPEWSELRFQAALIYCEAARGAPCETASGYLIPNL